MSNKMGWVLILGAIGLAIVGGLIWGSRERQEDKPGQRADSVLATDSTYLRRIQEQDSAIAHLEDSIRVTDAARKRWRDSARTLTRAADSSQAEIDATVAAGLPPGVDSATYFHALFQSQARVAATLRLQVIPALERTITEDSIGIKQRDEYGTEMRAQRDFARERAGQVTAEFARYRQATKPGIDLGLFRVPDWADDVALVVGTATLTYVAVK